MKVLHIISGGDSGGAKTHMFALLGKQTKIADVTVMCLMKGIFYEELIKTDIKNVLFEQRSRMDIGMNKRIAEYINNEKFDIVNCHGARANFVARAIKNRINIPILTTVHSDPLLDFDTLYKKLIFQNLNVMSLKKIDYKIAVSDAFKDMLISRGDKPNSVYTVFNGMDYEKPISAMERREFAKKYNITEDPDAVYFGIAARFNKVKGVDIFIKAAAELYKKHKNVYFLIAGDGDDEAELRALTASLHMEERILFLGFVSPIYDFLNFIDVNMLTSLSESFPYSMLEGAASSVPMVASRVGGIPKLVIEGETGFLFERGDYLMCAEKMARFVENRELILSMGNAIHMRATERFSDTKLAKDYVDIYEQVIYKYKRKNKYDIVLSGYYGFENFGDELMLKSLTDAIKKENRNLNMLVLSGNPEYTRKYTRIDSINRINVSAVRKSLKEAELFINGGGNLLQDVTSNRSLFFYLMVNRMAKNAGTKTAVVANGIGPLLNERNIKEAVKMLKGTDYITVRDEEALDFLKKNGVEGAKISPDLVFLSALNEGRVKIGGEKYFAVSLRSWPQSEEKLVNAVSYACDRIVSKYNMKCLFIPFQRDKDEDICRKTASKMKEKSEMFFCDDIYSRIDEIKTAIDNAEFVLGMRLHAVIYSFVRGVPCLGLEYDPKIKHFVEENGLDGVDFETLDRETLADKLESLVGKDGISNESIQSYGREVGDSVKELLSFVE